MPRIAIIGGGIAGVTAAWQLARDGHIDVTLFEARARLGGTVETVQREGFTIECGPDGWVTEKPWARALAEELGLADELIASNDGTRKTYVLDESKLVAMPDGMRMMVPSSLESLDHSALFSAEARRAYADELTRAETLKGTAPDHDESVASFVLRHFGEEVLRKIGAPLLNGVFGGDVYKLSVRAVMGNFVAMEREHGSLIAGLQARNAASANKPRSTVFTSLKCGTGALIDRMTAEIPPSWIRRDTPIAAISSEDGIWVIQTAVGREGFDILILATPTQVTASLLRPIDPRMAELTAMDASSAVIAALAFDESFDVPQGFGFLVPSGSGGSQLLAATFVDQKFPHRAPEGKRQLRAFFGGEAAQRLARQSDERIAALALTELQAILGPLPTPQFTVVRRWPKSLPQYGVGHLERMAELNDLVKGQPSLHLVGNAYRGVGLPDLIRDARAAAKSLTTDPYE